MTKGIAVQFLDIALDSIVRMGEARYRVTHVLSVDTVLAVNLASAEVQRLPIEQLVLERDTVVLKEADRPRDLSLYSAREWQQAQLRLQAIKGLIDDATRTRQAAEAAAAAAGVHVATLYRWLNDYLRVGNVSALVPAKRGRKAGTRLLSVGVEAIIDSVIEELYLTKQRHTPQDVIEEVEASAIDGREYKVRIDVGVRALDHRGLYKNAGQ
jgi:putative transposase